MVRSVRAAITILVTAVIVVLAEWLDHNVISDVIAQGQATFDTTGAMWAVSLGTLAIVAGVLGVGVLGWRSRSAVVGAAYVVAGGFLVFLPATPAVTPPSMTSALSEIWTWSSGPLNAVGTISGGMFVVGILVLARVFLDRSKGRAPDRLPSLDGEVVRQ